MEERQSNIIIKIADQKSNQFIVFVVVVTHIRVRVYSIAKSCLTLCNPIGCSHQTPLSMGFSRQKYWSGLPFSPPGHLPNPGVEPRSSTLQEDSLHCRWILYQLSHQGSPRILD